MAGRYILALDEGSSSARAILVDHSGQIVADASEEFPAIYPQPGWVELDPALIWSKMLAAIFAAMQKANATASDISAVGITSHRETALVWDRVSGQPIYNAIMWMSKQTDSIVNDWSQRGLDKRIRESTGLRNDSFFSAGKISWILENVPGAKKKAEAGELAFGTVDSWILWNITGGRAHATDRSAASRTSLLNLESGDWDYELADSMGITDKLLPELKRTIDDFGFIADNILPGHTNSPIPVKAIFGDQMAGMFGQQCLSKGDAKNSYGTAGVLTVNVGDEPLLFENLNTSFAWDIDGSFNYETEGVVFFSGKTIQFLRDNLGLIKDAAESEKIAGTTDSSGGVYIVPAFSGIGDPYWDRNAKASIMGMQLDTTRNQIVRAGLESLAYQTLDNFQQIENSGFEISALKVDGGAVKNDWLCQFQADILNVEVLRPKDVERTALGVAQAAGMGSGIWTKSDLVSQWRLDRAFEPSMDSSLRKELVDGWKSAVEATRSHRS